MGNRSSVPKEQTPGDDLNREALRLSRAPTLAASPVGTAMALRLAELRMPLAHTNNLAHLSCRKANGFELEARPQNGRT